MQQLRSQELSVQVELEQVQHQLQLNPSTTIHGLQQRLHQPVVDGEHLQPTNHLFK
jgi:hypothetical protein